MGASSPEPATTGLVLLSGAGLSPWIWEKVRPLLAQPSVVVSYPTDQSVRGRLSLAAYADLAAEQVDKTGFERLVIVAHSIGGVVGAELTGVVHPRAVGFLGLSAVIPPPGGSFISALPGPQQLVYRLAIRFAGTRPPDKVIRSGLCNDLPADLRDAIVSGFVPESRGLYRDRLASMAMPPHRGYVHTSRDRELSPAMQQRFAMRLGGRFRETIDSGHLLMLSAPQKTAATINRFVAALTEP